jgi:hypothetical protein
LPLVGSTRNLWWSIEYYISFFIFFQESLEFKQIK